MLNVRECCIFVHQIKLSQEEQRFYTVEKRKASFNLDCPPSLKLAPNSPETYKGEANALLSKSSLLFDKSMSKGSKVKSPAVFFNNLNNC